MIIIQTDYRGDIYDEYVTILKSIDIRATSCDELIWNNEKYDEVGFIHSSFEILFEIWL